MPDNFNRLYPHTRVTDHIIVVTGMPTGITSTSLRKPLKQKYRERKKKWHGFVYVNTYIMV